MAGHLLFVILIYSLNEIKAQALLPPKLTLSKTEIRETDSVTMNCEAPSSVSVTQCYFYTLSGGTVRNLPCIKRLTGAELLDWAKLRSPAEVKVRCYYSAQPGWFSPDGSISSINIQTSLPPKLIVNPMVITDTDTVTLKCETPPSVSIAQCHFYTSSGTIKNFSCMKRLTGTELLEWAMLRSPAEVKIGCQYIIKPRKTMSPSSNMSCVKVQNTYGKDGSTTDLTTLIPSETPSANRVDTGLMNSASADKITAVFNTKSTSLPVTTLRTAPETLKLLVVLAGCGVAVGVSLLGFALMRNLRKTGGKDGLTNKRCLGKLLPNEEANMAINSVPAPDNPVADFIEQGGKNPQNNESDTYDLYATIPQEPVPLSLMGMVYSTVEAH
ncbi:uncharacterized protein LOC109202204 [Oreochromis niloticus]|uniref:uncharacterized protein LOC109202204 n=1 Tax=Oreochromis niloticus TaxID=8128 RepID=UPI000904A2B1|nr:uncharacterized protein LOC109202204 [Oreochromis niloticus]